MTVLIVVLAALVGIGVGVAVGYWLPPNGRRAASAVAGHPAVRRILLPFTGEAISRRAFEAAVRLAKAEDATIMPAYLARVSRNMPIDSPLPAQCGGAMTVLEAIEQKATSLGVSVDSRIARGRTYRDALRRLLDSEQFDRVIVSAGDNPRVGLSGDDLQWLLERAPAEIMILRPAPDDTRRISANGLNGHF
jgi:nucleotide-binding universal stress UspA family protein